MIDELVSSAIRGNRKALSANSEGFNPDISTMGKAERTVLIVGSLALNNPQALAKMMTLVCGEEPDGHFNPDRLDIFLAGIALGRIATSHAPRTRHQQGRENYAKIKKSYIKAEATLKIEGKPYNKKKIIGIVSSELGVSKRTVERALSEEEPPF